MSSSQLSKKLKHFFILVGIGYYTPGSALLDKHGRVYRLRNLNGAVKDVTDMLEYINSEKFLESPRIIVLKSSKPTEIESKDPSEPEDERPTYENILRVFREVATEVEKAGGGIVHIHFSCHGVTVKTNYPQIKGVEGIDEAIAPYDIRTTDGEDTGQDATEHANMGDGTADSTGDTEDERTLGEWNESIKLPQDDTELMKTFRDVWAEGRSGWQANNVWLLPVRYDMFGACCLDEKAYEDVYNGKFGGAYTHALLKVLEDCRIQEKTPMLGQVYKRIVAMFRKDERRQTPVFVGNSDRHWLRETEGTNVRSLSVISSPCNRVILSEGLAQGVTKGSTYAIYPWYETDHGDISDRPLVVIDEVRPNQSSATWVASRCEAPNGSQAVLLRYKIDDIRIIINEELAESNEKYKEFCDFVRQERAIGGDEMDMIEIIKKGPTSNNRKGSTDNNNNNNNNNNNTTEGSTGNNATAPYTISNSLNVTGFNFSPYWGAQIFHPEDEDFDAMTGGKQTTVSWNVAPLPDDWDRSTDYVDCVKIFISEKSLSITTFQSVQMDDITVDTSVESRGDDSLMDLLLNLGAPDRGFTRETKGLSSKSPWITLMFRIRTVARTQ
ncbi:hypothetical protein DL768_010101 [Monosporascus sp. mg162]|nr:hypothetical protein DL768_010101 [Monosporascus sp. mg162]